MKANSPIERQHELTKTLQDAAKAYYDEDRELMPNIEYDKLYDELLDLEAETGIVLAGSPTGRVGYEVSTELRKKEHPSPMLSLNKTKSIEDLESWLGDKDGMLSFKLDGLTVALTYSDGKLEDAVTRGNGIVGEVVTNNAKTFMNLPVNIPCKERLSLRGEAIIRYSDFNEINRRNDEIDAKYKNPRNLVSGSVRQLDSEVTASRMVRFYAFGLVATTLDGDISKSRKAQMAFLKEQGFETVEYEMINSSSLRKGIEEFSEKAHNEVFDFPVDGLVLEYDDIEYGASLGATSKYPRDAIAFKWADEQAETTLLEIEWSASRTGLINPIAVFEPVDIEGTTVSRASVHNISILEELKLKVGDTIKVYKANMIIPQIAENLTKNGPEDIPANCPACGANTEIRDLDGIRTLHCPNPSCPAKNLKTFTHFVSRPAMNIEGLSEQTIEKFISEGLLHELADIFKLKDKKQEIVVLDGFGEKSFNKLISAIEIAKTTTCDRLLTALGIPEVGTSTAKEIAKFFGHDWSKIKIAKEEDLSQIDGVGDVIAKEFSSWFRDESNIKKIDSLEKEIEFLKQASEPGSQKLDGLIFVITGSLEGYKSRDDLKELIEKCGGKTASSVSNRTDYLINNDSTSQSSKNKKAHDLGVKIITEKEFEELL